MFLYLTMLVLMRGAACVTKDNALEVHSAAGTFRGRILTSLNGRNYTAYKGIPYALPPIGERRFSLPEGFPKIEGVHDASEFGPICVQYVEGRVQGQEDCLYLNVYTPIRGKNAEADTQAKKVLAFIHGGGFSIGSSNPYLPGDLVTSRGIVVVTMNYRLGFLGFLRGNSDALPGNQGLWDQVLALQWINKNIRAFGGDPNDVTVSGESVGSVSASVLSISPVAKYLFKKAILFSSTGFSFPSPHRTSNDLLETAAALVGCDQDSQAENKDVTIECLKKAPLEHFKTDRDKDFVISLISSGNGLLPKPIPELVADQEYLYQAGFFNRDYIISVTGDDGSVLVNSRFQKIDTTNLDSGSEGIAKLLHMPLYLAKLLLAEYQKLFLSLEKSAIAVITDGFFIKQSHHFLDVYMNFSKHDKSSSRNKAYFMSFDHAPQYEKNQYMLHALDLVYLFDFTPEFLDCFYEIEFGGNFTDKDFALRSDFINLIADFVESSNPSITLTKQKGILWPPADFKTWNYLSFSLQPSVRQDALGNRRVIWEEMIPHWQREHRFLQNREDL